MADIAPHYRHFSVSYSASVRLCLAARVFDTSVNFGLFLQLYWSVLIDTYITLLLCSLTVS